ncbi:MAG: uroporphyrinogen decarboxylase [Candidatus Dadabacteria bacterium]|nr:uroporphyrinogen decarboxylase [Candidatus Dadabacteria bacterium]NIS07871.1 uroporphyrinogen decarboxylase [Candidatus Dadabacteria bacterium]NIV42891.1 uroporphyrinogen decarboxylase [Candidatus Dadabacteria bacterium]NIX14861.1 uroporphyrinogen decarboxylase [Candidatus Dadabacteria bacterium]NIY21475.1 uroporphyrinogen decarboxylase [Candidatus Dadabacteria bacterium]
MKHSFNNLSVASFESRRSKEIGRLIEYHGGIAHIAESVVEIPSKSSKETEELCVKLKNSEIDIIIFLTGFGTKLLLENLEKRLGTKPAKNLLSKITLVGRGIKSRSALRNFGVTPMYSKPVPNTWQDIVKILEDKDLLQNKTVAIQEYSKKNSSFTKSLKSGGAKVISIPVYKSALPRDTSSLENLINNMIRGRIDICLFTSSQQVANIFRFAKKLNKSDKLLQSFKNTVTGSVGSNTSLALYDHGIRADYEPENSRMGNLVREMARRSEYLLTKKRTSAKNSVDTNIWKRIDTNWGNLSEKKRKSITYKSEFMKACRREKTDYTPIWIMRQAGRFSRHYRAIRASQTFLKLCKSPEISSEVTLMAVDQLGVDAAIIFSDILLILEPLGINITYTKSDGPRILNPLRTKKSIENIRRFETGELDFMYESLRITRKALSPEIPLIGFAGAPFTLASYAIEGGSSRNFELTKSLMYKDPELWHQIMSILTNATVKYLNRQAKEGADVVQLFDSWIGCLSPGDYKSYVFPHMKELFSKIDKNVPAVHFGTGTASLLKLMKQAGGTVIGFDWRVDIDKAWKDIGYTCSVQGNIDPIVLFSTPSIIRKKVKELLKKVDGRNGHIFNLGHGVLPGTPPDNVLALIDAVHEYSSR